MASLTDSSSRSTSLMPGRIVIAFDATRNRHFKELNDIITHILMRVDMIQDSERITVFGVLHKVIHPLGFQIQIGSKSFVGTNIRAVKEDVSRKVDAIAGILQRSAAECVSEEVEIEAKISVGAPMENIVVQEIVSSNATWAILDRQLRTESRFYLKHIPCKIAVVRDNLSLEVLRPYDSDKYKDIFNHKVFYSLSKPVILQIPQDNESDKLSVDSVSMNSPRSYDAPKNGLVPSFKSYFKDPKSFLKRECDSNSQQETSGSFNKHENGYDDSPQMMLEQRSRENHSENPVFCNASKLKMQQISAGCNYSEIQAATHEFSGDNLLGEGGYGLVYKGALKNGQLIVAKVKTEANIECCEGFLSEVDALSSAGHKNIVMVLGYCYKDKISILVHEYISNKSLHWHLFDNRNHVLQWNQRQSIAIGTAKGLRFLHEECRGSPIVHRDVRPSNILLTHDFVPMLADCSLTKWRTKIYDQKPRSIHNFAYLAPEYRENGICSVDTDVYAFGIILIQIISGRKDVDPMPDNENLSLRQWALPLIRKLALDELVDPRLGRSYSTRELHQMAIAAYSCVHSKPAMRPAIGEVLHLLEGENGRLRHFFMEQLMTHKEDNE